MKPKRASPGLYPSCGCCITQPADDERVAFLAFSWSQIYEFSRAEREFWLMSNFPLSKYLEKWVRIHQTIKIFYSLFVIPFQDDLVFKRVSVEGAGNLVMERLKTNLTTVCIICENVHACIVLRNVSVFLQHNPILKCHSVCSVCKTG